MNHLRTSRLIGITWLTLAMMAPVAPVRAQRPLFAPSGPTGPGYVPRHVYQSSVAVPVMGERGAASRSQHVATQTRGVSPSHRQMVQPTYYQEQDMGFAEPEAGTQQQDTGPTRRPEQLPAPDAGSIPQEEMPVWDGEMVTEYGDEVEYGGEVIEYGDEVFGAPYGDMYCGSPLGFARLWGRAEYIVWWTKAMNVPPLVTTSDANTGQDEAGVLGLASTDILFGNGGLNDEARSGGRFTIGTWLDPADTYGWEANYMFLGEESNGFVGSDDDLTILARPFFNTDLNAEDSRLIVFPNVVEGQLSVDVRTEFEASEVLYRRAAVRSRWTEVDYYLGYRYAGLDDEVRIDEATTALAAPVAGVQIDLFDQFQSRNTFHGGQLGLRLVSHANPWWRLEFLGKFAVGGTRTRASINGQTTTTAVDGSTSTATGGLLALPSNIGVFEENELSTITEFGVTFRGRLQPGVTASFGYTLLYWSDVARAGQLIDTRIDPSQIPPGTLTSETRPAVTFVPSDFWAQGLNFGLEYRF